MTVTYHEKPYSEILQQQVNCGWFVGNPDIERQRIGTGNLTNGTTAKAKENYGPIMVQQLFPSALNAPLDAIRVA